jgi:hypothetical protein
MRAEYIMNDDWPSPWEECATLEEVRDHGPPHYPNGVNIWSGEHQLWWRSGASGYTPSRCEAGVYSFSEAWSKTCHCGPEKQIEYYPCAAPSDG